MSNLTIIDACYTYGIYFKYSIKIFRISNILIFNYLIFDIKRHAASVLCPWDLRLPQFKNWGNSQTKCQGCIHLHEQFHCLDSSSKARLSLFPLSELRLSPLADRVIVNEFVSGIFDWLISSRVVTRGEIAGQQRSRETERRSIRIGSETIWRH